MQIYLNLKVLNGSPSVGEGILKWLLETGDLIGRYFHYSRAIGYGGNNSRMFQRYLFVSKVPISQSCLILNTKMVREQTVSILPSTEIFSDILYKVLTKSQ